MDIESGFSYICRNASESQFEILSFRDVKISNESAEVDVLVKALLQLPSSRPADGTYEVTISWQKTSDGWRYHKVVWNSASL